MSGVASSVWTALVSVAVIPYYLRYLGVDAYGLIGFFATAQAMFQILDLGLGPTINREVARCSAQGRLSDARKLLHTLAVVYWGMGAAIAMFMAALAPVIATKWLESSSLPDDTIRRSVLLMGLVLGCRWPIALYTGALIGAQRIVALSTVSIAMVSVANVGAVGVLAFVDRSIEAFFVWQALAGFLHAVVMRWAAWNAVGRAKDLRFDVAALRSIWRFSAGMTGVAITGVLFSQLDKIVLSKVLDLADFGRYMLAVTVAGVLQVLVITPTFNVVFPKFSALVESHRTDELRSLYRLSTRLLCTVLCPAAMLLALSAQDLVSLWTGNPALAAHAAPLIALLVTGSALHGAMHLPYALQLAYGAVRLPLQINSILMVILLPLIIVLAGTFGAIGAAFAWLTLHSLYLLLGTWLTHRQLLSGLGRDWLLRDIGIPLGASVIAGLLGVWVLRTFAISMALRFGVASLLGLAAASLSLAGSPETRKALITSLRSARHGSSRRVLT